ncbi:MAG: FAD-binding protein, partial [Sorangiineae bacterium PRO1]|nr:FAD-binding protein [Sorangiineae bacterium PRO1]
MIELGRRLGKAARWSADVVIVGTGAGGGMAASELARRGARVIALEEGPALSARDMSQREDEMMPLLYQERGGRSTADLSIRVIGGRTVGGSTVHNINLCKRLPPEVLELWAREHQVSGLSEAELRPVFESVERDLSVSEIEPERRNANNRVLERAVAALGWKGGPLQHNRLGCQGSGFCEIGCPYDAKQNAAKVLLPDAVDRGARVVADVRVTRILHDGRRARGVVGVALGEDGRPVA